MLGSRLIFVLGLVAMPLAISLAGVPATPFMGGRPAVPAKPSASSVKAEIFTDSNVWVGGKPLTVAIVLTTNPEWHIYWTNCGDSGIATEFKPDLRSDLKLQRLPFPIPTEFSQAGGLKGYGYSGKVAFLFRITPPQLATHAGPPVKFAVTWLCCNKDQCVPGSATVELPMDWESGILPAKAQNQELIAAAQAALPLDGPEKAEVTVSRGDIAMEGQAASWPLSCAWAKGAPAKVEVFPDNVDRVAVTAVKTEYDSKGTAKIAVTAHRMGLQALKSGENLPILVVATAADGKRSGFFVPLDLSVLNRNAEK